MVICSHTLEDSRSVVGVLGNDPHRKGGLHEVPSRRWESCRGHEAGIAGLSHHRWLIDIEENKLRFTQKFHKIHNWRYSLPAAVLRRMPEIEKVSWLFWRGSFEFSEVTLHGEAQTQELDVFVNSVRPYPSPLLAASRILARVDHLSRRAIGKAGRSVARLSAKG